MSHPESASIPPFEPRRDSNERRQILARQLLLTGLHGDIRNLRYSQPMTIGRGDF